MIAPVSNARQIVESALAPLDLKFSAAGEHEVMAGLERSLRFDHDARRFLLVDDAGNPLVEVDEAGQVREVSLQDHLRMLAARKPGAFEGQITGETRKNPFLPGSAFNRTNQALLMKSDPEAAARLKAQAEASAGNPDNPWLDAHWNRTKQALITNKDPLRAERLKAEAGR